ncbi:MAG: hypothetical protein KF745_09140 [Phycisphaeraceae bacterium]|nr:hypothetical protein [Phycisphaeraceae bacterium]
MSPAPAVSVESATNSVVETLRRIRDFPFVQIENRPHTIGSPVVIVAVVAIRRTLRHGNAREAT